MKLWRITGTRRGTVFTVRVQAENRNDAVRKGSNHPHMLVVRDCVLIDDAKLLGKMILKKD